MPFVLTNASYILASLSDPLGLGWNLFGTANAAWQPMLTPGDSTTIESCVFMMYPGMDGKHDYAVDLKTRDPTNPDMVVHVLSDWGP